MGRRLFFDCETNGLLEDTNVVHVLVCRDVDTNEVFDFDRLSIEDGLEMLNEADLLIAHNGIGFDVPAINKVYPGRVKWDMNRFIDTMILSRAIWSNLKDAVAFPMFRRQRFPAHLLMKPHSLEAWGHYLSNPKAEFNGPWDQWTQAMHDYCIQDTSTLRDIYRFMYDKDFLPTVAKGLIKHEVNPLVAEIELELAWYLQAQELNGFPFDVDKAVELYAMLSAKREAVGQRLITRFGTWYESDGEKTPKKDITYVKNEIAPRRVTLGASYTKIVRVEFNPSSRAHIGNRLIKEYGWKPNEYGEDGNPTVDEDTLKGLTYDIIPDLCEYLLLDKRIGMLAEGNQAWLKVHRNGRIHHHVNQSGAATHRATHSHPNMTQVPKVRSPYGKECRSLFHVPDGWVQVGADASGLELRGLAHFLARYDGGAYVEKVLHGDVHTENLNAAKPHLQEREQSKTFIYAFIYGAGDPKLGSISKPSAQEDEQRSIGSKLRVKFRKSVVGLDQVISKIEEYIKAARPLPLPSGHKVYIRQRHSALNFLIQGTGAVICKLWIVLFARELRKMGLKCGWNGDWVPLVWAHDEVQLAVRNRDGLPERVRDVVLAQFPVVTQTLNIRCPLAGEAKLGRNWAECH